MREHLDWNEAGNVTVIEAAVGDREGEVQFAFRPNALDPGSFANSLAYDVGGETVKVRMTTIDTLCAGSTPDLIKIDVEGAEMLAVMGARQTLTRLSPLVILAFHPDAMRNLGHKPAEIVALLDTLGYTGRHLDGRAATDPGFEEIIFEKRQVS